MISNSRSGFYEKILREVRSRRRGRTGRAGRVEGPSGTPSALTAFQFVISLACDARVAGVHQPNALRHGNGCVRNQFNRTGNLEVQFDLLVRRCTHGSNEFAASSRQVADGHAHAACPQIDQHAPVLRAAERPGIFQIDLGGRPAFRFSEGNPELVGGRTGVATCGIHTEKGNG